MTVLVDSQVSDRCLWATCLLKFFVKVVRSLYLLNMLMDQVDTLHVCRYWSEILCFYDPPERP